ncbi:MAG: phage portal protein [Actinobacteria bacterium]|nr:phage portal protein [Actinomycetota bacterium]
MSILRSLVARSSAMTPTRNSIPWDSWLSFFTFDGHAYPAGFTQTWTEARQEIADGTFPSFAGVYRSNGVIYACMLSRFALFSEARFQYQRFIDGRPGDMFGDATLRPLEAPWPGGTTGDLLARMLTDADLAGNAYVLREGSTLKRLRPDWVSILIGSPDEATDEGAWDPDATVLGYAYQVGGRNSHNVTRYYLPSEVAHYAPVPDPLSRFRGMSWLTPIIREIAADSAARDHKLRFFENGATPNMVVRLDKDSKASASSQEFKDWVSKMREQEPRGRDFYRTMYLAGGADVTVVGADLRQLDFKITQGAGETRIAAAAGVPPVIVGLSEGLAAATYSNYGQARRRFADLTIRPLWRNAAGSLSVIVRPPAGVRLWYDDRDIPFLAEDRKDIAETAGREAQTISGLVVAGFTPDSVVSSVKANDWSLLQHSGLYSEQLQPPTNAARTLAAMIAPYLPTGDAA